MSKQFSYPLKALPRYNGYCAEIVDYNGASVAFLQGDDASILWDDLYACTSKIQVQDILEQYTSL